MSSDIDHFFLQKEEPVKSCLLAMRDIILNYNENVTETWKYQMPFYCYHGKMFCYLWVHKKFKQPYLGIVDGHKVEHPKLVQEKRTRMKIFLLDPQKDIPVNLIRKFLKQITS